MKSEHYRSPAHTSTDATDLNYEIPAVVSTSTLKRFTSRSGVQPVVKRRLAAHWVRTDQGLHCAWVME